MDLSSESDIQIARLLAKERQYDLNSDERAVLDDWLTADPANRVWYDELRQEERLLQKLSSLHTYDSKKALTRVKQRIQASSQSAMRFRMRTLLALTASLLVVMLLGWWVLKPHVVTDSAPTDALPAQSFATLLLADGRTVSLSDQQEGIRIEGDRLVYSDGTTLQDLTLLSDVQYLTIRTPKGGQYHITLPDRTQVWLNAESTLQYPVRFTDTERRVILTGEAYFSVTKAQSSAGIETPFIVQSDTHEVTVLGTEFNINAYRGEEGIATTLVEGSVQVHTTVGDRPYLELIPGEQSILKGKKLYKQKASIREVLAWKEGRFVFQNTPLREVLHQLARWYDVEMPEEDNIPKRKLTGNLPRRVPLSEVLRLIQMTSGLTFELKEGRLQFKE